MTSYYFKYQGTTSKGNKQLKRNGISDSPLPEVIFEQSGFQIWKMKGGVFRCGYGETAYASTEYALIAVEPDHRCFTKGGYVWRESSKEPPIECSLNRWVGYEIYTIQPGKLWKKEVDWMQSKIELLVPHRASLDQWRINQIMTK